MRDRPVISIENYTTYCGNADEKKVGGCVIAVKKDYNNLVEGFGSTSSRCAFVRLRDSRKTLYCKCPRKLRKPLRTTVRTPSMVNALMSKIPSQQVVIEVVVINANVKVGLEQQSDVVGKWYYSAEQMTNNGNRLVDL
ncbi:hypothetical protein RB195_013459 [Necator americanus]|uniref:Uncharacterized protein n=1 Tax=Necator americanus TaxID=51031 RepID=A0ABR1DVN1_NECAM